MYVCVFNFDFAVGVLQILRDIHTDYNKPFSNYTRAKCIYLYLLTAVNPVTANLAEISYTVKMGKSNNIGP